MKAAYTIMVGKLIQDLQKSYYNLMVAEMNRPEAQAELEMGGFEVMNEYIAARILGSAYTVMDIWGRGSLMDAENLFNTPGYYLTQKYWNPERKDFAISTRARPYTNIFDEVVQPTGKFIVPGVNIEHLPGFEPWPPSYAHRVAMDQFTDFEAKALVQNAMNSIPWSSFIIGTKDKYE